MNRLANLETTAPRAMSLEKEDAPVGIEGRRDLILGTPETCFFCLENFEVNSLDRTITKTDLQQVSFQRICRYLNINERQILTSSININSPVGNDTTGDTLTHPAHSENDPGSILVSLCNSCAFVTQMLSHFLQEMEITQMLIHQQFQKFQQILLDTVPRRPEYAATNATAWTNLRKETVEKCAVKLTNLKRACLPKVTLQRIDDIVSKEKSSPPVRSIGQEKLLMVRQRYLKKLKVPGRYKCNLCAKEMGAGNTSQHMISVHPEKYFLDCKLSSVTEANLNKLCLAALSKLTRSGRILQKRENSRENAMYRCVYCRQKRWGGKDMRYHLAVNHYHTLRAKLINAQDETNNVSDRPSPPQQVGSFVPRARIPKKLEVIQVTRWRCEDDETGKGCGGTWSRNSDLLRHKRYSCLIRKKPAIPTRERAPAPEAIPEQESARKENTVWKCHAGGCGCGKLFTNREHVSRHIREQLAINKSNVENSTRDSETL